MPVPVHQHVAIQVQASDCEFLLTEPFFLLVERQKGLVLVNLEVVRVPAQLPVEVVEAFVVRREGQLVVNGPETLDSDSLLLVVVLDFIHSSQFGDSGSPG